MSRKITLVILPKEVESHFYEKRHFGTFIQRSQISIVQTKKKLQWFYQKKKGNLMVIFKEVEYHLLKRKKKCFDGSTQRKRISLSQKKALRWFQSKKLNLTCAKKKKTLWWSHPRKLNLTCTKKKKGASIISSRKFRSHLYKKMCFGSFTRRS